jgi:hypothetical protein
MIRPLAIRRRNPATDDPAPKQDEGDDLAGALSVTIRSRRGPTIPKARLPSPKPMN